MDVLDTKTRQVNIQSILDSFITFDEPIPFKGLMVYPVMLKEWNSFICLYDVISIDKNSSGNIEYIKMSYLDFLANNIMSELVNNPEMSITATKLILILSLCLKVDGKDIDLVTEDNNHWSLVINDIKLDSKEFDQLKRVILYQNIAGYDEKDKFVDPSLKKAFEEYQRLTSRGYKEKPLDEQIAVVQSHTGMRKLDILEMTARSFKLLFNACVSEIDYQCLKTAELSGNVEFKHAIEHWAFNKGYEDKYSRAFVSQDEYMNKMASVT